MKSLPLALILCFYTALAKSETNIKMNFKNEELSKVIEAYSKASNQKFIIDPAVRGKVSILLPQPVSVDEAFNQLSSALAVNGFAISKQGDTMIVKSARSIQRDLIEVSSARPNLKPERMVVWIYTPKNISVRTIVDEMRMLSSKDGEMSVLAKTNQVVFTDWASSLNRVADLLEKVDQPSSPKK